MTKYVYPQGPTKEELHVLKIQLRNHQRLGLFINEYEFETFAGLLAGINASAKAMEVVPASASSSHDAAAAVNAVDANTECAEADVTIAASVPAIDVSDVAEQSRPSAPLYSLLKLHRLQENLSQMYRDGASRDQLTSRFEKMRARGGFRALRELPVNWCDRLDQLVQRYPNFLAVVEQVRTECQLAAFSDPRVVRLPPILLAGEPGIGKTAFARDLATLLDSGFFSHSLETAQSGATIAGSSRYWSNTCTGLVFDALVDHDTMNPVILVDELDKASTDTRNDPAAAFYQLLERSQAATFCDESIPDLPIDASHITWIFTANDMSRVPAPIGNRLMVFHVPRPSAEQGRLIVHHLFDETVADITASIQDSEARAMLTTLTMSPQTVSVLAQESVRQAKLRLRSAIANALARGLSIVQLSDEVNLAVLGVVAGPAGAH